MMKGERCANGSRFGLGGLVPGQILNFGERVRGLGYLWAGLKKSLKFCFQGLSFIFPSFPAHAHLRISR